MYKSNFQASLIKVQVILIVDPGKLIFDIVSKYLICYFETKQPNKNVPSPLSAPSLPAFNTIASIHAAVIDRRD